ncbi:unnamed protein product [Rotaria sp. Silwood2]|nr:unnamed protein product [Rotaria sp. Silwood2]
MLSALDGGSFIESFGGKKIGSYRSVAFEIISHVRILE